MTKLQTELRLDYLTLMDCFWTQKPDLDRRLAGVKKFLAQHKNPPLAELDRWIGRQEKYNLVDNILIGAMEQRTATPKELQLIKLLLAAGLAQNSRKTPGRGGAARNDLDKPLISAICNCDLALVKLYLAHGANPNTLKFEVPPLFVAAVKNSPPLVKILLAHGANPKQKIALDEKPGFGILPYLHRELSLINKINNWCRDFQAMNFKNFNDVKNMVNLLCRHGVTADEKHGPGRKTLVKLLSTQKEKIKFSDYNNHEELSDINHWSVMLMELANNQHRVR